MPQRVTLLNSVFLDSKRNHAFPQVALHGALWAYRFYDRRGTVSRLITYRYFYDREERALPPPDERPNGLACPV
jgi:hypothetical protein